MVGKVDDTGEEEHGDCEEEDGVCSAGLARKEDMGEKTGEGLHVLNTNFSVGVNMYSEKVTSYW